MFSCDDKLLLTLSSLVAGHNCTCGHTNAHRLCISVTHCLEMKFEGHVCFLWDSECLFGLPVSAHIHWVVKKMQSIRSLCLELMILSTGQKTQS